MRRDLAPLAERPFRLLLAGTTVAHLGQAIAAVALAFAVLDLTGSAADLGVVLASRTIPMVAFLVIGGVVADRLPRHLVTVGANLVSAAAQAAVAVLLLTGEARVGHLVVLQVFAGSAAAFAFPATSALTPQTVPREQLQAANALLRLGRNTAMIAGSAAAGLLVAAIGSGWGMAVDAATYATAALLLAGIRVPRDRPMVAPDTLRELREGWGEFRSHTWLWAVVLQFALANAVLAGGVATLGPLVADQTVGRPAWGLVLAAETAGMVVGGLLMLRWRPGRPLLVGVTCSALPALLLLALGVWPALLALLVTAVLAGLGIEVFGVTWDLSLQENVPQDRLSRVYSYDAFGSLAAMPIGQLVAGPAALAFGVGPTLTAAAALVAGAAAVTAALPDVRRLHRIAA